MARFAGAGGRGSRGGGRGRGRRPHPGRGKPQAGPGAAIVDQEQSASYRPMGAALTIQEVSNQYAFVARACRSYKAEPAKTMCQAECDQSVDADCCGQAHQDS